MMRVPATRFGPAPSSWMMRLLAEPIVREVATFARRHILHAQVTIAATLGSVSSPHGVGIPR